MNMKVLIALISIVRTAKAAYDLDYFDRLRTNSSLQLAYNNSSVSPDRLWEVTDISGETFQLAQITAFLPFTDGTAVREAVEDDLFATLLAIHHFNNPELSPHLTPEDLEGCNIKLTTEFEDTQYSPIHSTRRFTEILQRENELSLPLPAGVIGAYRSAVTSPLAILSGVNDIPQISYASTSTDFDVKEQYPLFGRTIQSSTGEAQVALELFKSLGATHVGVLFVTDAFGSALQKAFQDAASEAGIISDSVAFSYSADLNGSEIPNAIESLKKTQFQLFYVIAFEVHFEAIMKAATYHELVGGDYLWLFDGFDAATFQRNAAFPPGSDLDKATRGVGLISIEGGVRTEIQHPGNDNVPPPVEKNATSSYEKFRTAWRSNVQDGVFTAYARSRLPTELQDVKGYDPGYQFGMEAVSYTPFLYDAITALGLSYCRAFKASNGSQFGGQAVFDQFRNLDFDGATGNVVILNETGTRDYNTEVFVLLNAQPSEKLDKNGNVVYNLVPTSVYQRGWVPIKGRKYVYAGGSTEVPKSLPEPNMEMNYIGLTGRAVGYTLMGIVIAGTVFAITWLTWFRNEPVVRSSQPIFLFMVAMGSLVMATSIIPLSLEEPVPESGLDSACMAAPWLYLSGAIIAFSALLAKTRGVRHAYLNPDLDFIHVTPCDIFGTFFILYVLNLVVMISWQLVAPLEWLRVNRDSTDSFDRPVESYGTCGNEDALPFVVVIAVVNISILLVANWWAYQSRNIETEYQESRYIGISMASILQAWCMGIPILIVVWDNPQAKFFVEAGIVFVTALAVLLLIFIPKILAIRSDRAKAAEESKRIAYNSFTERAKQKEEFEPYDEEEKEKEIVATTTENDVGLSPTSDLSPEAALAAIPDDQEHSESLSHVLGSERQSQHIQDDSSQRLPSSPPRNSNFLANSLSNIARSVRFSSGAQTDVDLSGNGSGSYVGGIRVTHNPRSQRNLEVTGGREFSRAQLANFDHLPNHIEDDAAEDKAQEELGKDGDLSNIIEEKDTEPVAGRSIPSQ